MTSMGLASNTISSVKVTTGYEAVMFNNWDYSGASVVISGNTACLSNFNDRTSPIIVRPANATTAAAASNLAGTATTAQRVQP